MSESQNLNLALSFQVLVDESVVIDENLPVFFTRKLLDPMSRLGKKLQPAEGLENHPVDLTKSLRRPF